MLRRATFRLQQPNLTKGKRIAFSKLDQKLEIDPNKLYLTLDALHFEEKSPATPQEKKFFGVDEAYSGNANGDLMEGGRNIVWACNNKRCKNRADRKWRQGLFRFLKYPQQKTCPWCGTEDIYDWEFETFQTTGELMAKTEDGRYRFQTWIGQPVNLGHDDKKVIGEIEDVWVEPEKSSIVELISLNKKGEHGNERVVRSVESGRINSGSMELLTGIGMCSICFNVHVCEEDFCDHLRHEKGLVNPRTGFHVFEICKSIQGCGHAILPNGDPADSKALVRNVFAEKKATSLDTNIYLDTSIMMNGKPDFSEAKEKQTKKVSKTVAQMRGDSGGEYVSEKPLPDIKDMGAQLKAFGNYDSTRSPEEIKLASMSPEERTEYLEFQEFKKAKAKGASHAISSKPTFRVDKGFIQAALKQAVDTGKVTPQQISDTLVTLTSDKEGFIGQLADRKLISNTLTRLSIRKAQVSEDDLKEVVVDVLADALIGAGEATKKLINESTYDDVANGAGELVGDAGSDDDFKDFLGGDSDEGSEEPIVKHPGDDAAEEEAMSMGESPMEGKNLFEEEHREHENDEEPSDSVEDEMKRKEKKATKKQAGAGLAPEFTVGTGTITTEKFPTKPTNVSKPTKLENKTDGGKGYETTPATTEFPEAKPVDKGPKPGTKDAGQQVGGNIQDILVRRAQKIAQQLENGEGDTEKLVEEITKIEAQMTRIAGQDMKFPFFYTFSTEKFPEQGKDLGGDGKSKNFASVPAETGGDFYTSSTEKFPETGTDLGGAINKNPAPPRLASLRKAADIPDAADLEKLTPVQKNSLELQLIKANILTVDRQAGTESSKLDGGEIAQLRKMGLWPSDSEKKEAQAMPDSEKFPEAKDASDTPAVEKTLEQKATTEPFPEAEDANGDLKLGQATQPKSESELLKLQNVGSKTDVPDMEAHTLGDPTKSDSDNENIANQGNTTETKPGAAAKEMDKHLDRAGEEGHPGEEKHLTQENTGLSGGEVSDSEQDANLGKTETTKLSKSGDELDKARCAQITPEDELTAEFEQVTEKHQASKSNWTVWNKGGEPIFRIALRDAFPGEVVSRYDNFASEEYADALIGVLKERGIEAVNKEEFGGSGKVFNAEERQAMRKAQTQPAAAPSQGAGAPVMVDPAVSDKILNEAKPGISVVDLVASQAAPIIAESETLSVTTFIEELVNIAQSQEKVTELTTKLNEDVDKLKQQSGMPEEPTTGTSPTVSPTPPPEAQGAAPMTQLQASRKMGESEKKWQAMAQALRIEPVVKEEQNWGLIPNYNFLRTPEGGNLSRKEAAEKAKQVLQSRVAELMKLPEEAYLIVEKEIKTACRRARAMQGNKLPGAKRDAERKKVRWNEMQREAQIAGGGNVISNLPGSVTVAKDLPEELADKKRLSNFKFKVAHGIDPERLSEAIKSWENRSPRKS